MGVGLGLWGSLSWTELSIQVVVVQTVFSQRPALLSPFNVRAQVVVFGSGYSWK